MVNGKLTTFDSEGNEIKDDEEEIGMTERYRRRNKLTESEVYRIARRVNRNIR